MKRPKASARKRGARPKAEPSWDVRYDAAQLERWAQTLLGGVPYPAALSSKQKNKTAWLLPAMWMNDSERWSIAEYLYKLAQIPKAIDAVIKARPRPAKKRGAPAKAVRNWKIRLDHKVTQERLGAGHAKRAVGEVADAHGVRRSAVYATRACEKAATWTEWEQYERGSARAENPGLSDNAVLLKISKKMRRPENSITSR